MNIDRKTCLVLAGCCALVFCGTAPAGIPLMLDHQGRVLLIEEFNGEPEGNPRRQHREPLWSLADGQNLWYSVY